jgi:lipopolysaccharide transport system permease protein
LLTQARILSYSIDSNTKYSLSKYVEECYSYRSILVTFIQRNIKIKYANTLVGLIWGILQPLVYIFLLVIVFNKVAGLNTEGASPIAYAAVGLIPWIYFSQSLSNTSALSLSTQNIISKVYFPRIFLPLSALGESLIDLIIITCISLAVGAWTLSWHILYLPFILTGLIILTLGTSILVSMWTIRFPDVRFLLPLFLKVLIFLTPIAYTSALFEGSLKVFLYINPLVGYIEALRWSIMGTVPDIQYIYTSIVITLLLIIISLYFFIRFERKIGDII